MDSRLPGDIFAGVGQENNRRFKPLGLMQVHQPDSIVIPGRYIYFFLHPCLYQERKVIDQFNKSCDPLTFSGGEKLQALYQMPSTAAAQLPS